MRITATSPASGIAAAERIRPVIDLIARQPNIAPRLPKRPTVRVALVLRYPYKVFYRVQGEEVEILHIRHTARRPWIDENG